MNLETNKIINRLVNLLSAFKTNKVYFSIDKMTISSKVMNDSTEIETFPLFESAEIILDILEQNNIKFREKDIKIINN